MTGAERVAVLDGALNSGYGDFDSLILTERARAQAQAAAAGVGSGGGGQDGAGGGVDDGQPIFTVPGAGSGPSGVGGPSGLPGVLADAGSGRAGAGLGGRGGDDEQVFPPPEDIPSGRDDDVVARQLREAAMREPDPELREKLWDEYRNYTGLGSND